VALPLIAHIVPHPGCLGGFCFDYGVVFLETINYYAKEQFWINFIALGAREVPLVN